MPAARRPKQLKAVISLCSTDDRYEDDVHYKGGTVINEMLGWAATMLAYSSRPPDPALVGERWRAMWLERLQAGYEHDLSSGSEDEWLEKHRAKPSRPEKAPKRAPAIASLLAARFTSARGVLAARSRKVAAPTFSPDGLYFLGPRYAPHWGLPDRTPAYDGLP